MSAANKEIVRSFFESFSRHDLDHLAQLVTEDIVVHGSTNQGREGILAEAQYWFSAFSDASSDVEDLIAEGDRVAARVSSSGTNDGPFMGAPATGTRVAVQEQHVFRIESGRIAELWTAPDIHGVMEQLGLIPAEDHA